jgi:hypothetical protein
MVRVHFLVALMAWGAPAVAADPADAAPTGAEAELPEAQDPAPPAEPPATEPAPEQPAEPAEPPTQATTHNTSGARPAQASVEVREMTGNASQQVFTLEVEDPSKRPPPPVVPTWQPPEPEEVVAPPPPESSPLLAQRPPAYDLPVQHKVFPKFPENYAILHGNKKVRCVARVWVDRHGAPLRTSVMECPAGMHLLAASAIGRWRWEKPDVTVPPGGLEVEAVVGFLRELGGREGKPYFPGVTWLENPLEVTADPSRPALIRAGDLPSYPEQVIHGDAVCDVELTVSRSGATKDILIDGCSLPYREATFNAVKRWKFSPAIEDGEEVDSPLTTRVVFALEQPASAKRPGGP